MRSKLKGCPVSIRGTRKYTGGKNSNGMFNARSFPGLSFLPAKIKSAMIDCANNALSVDTWKRYNVISGNM